jgi:hypothetical protein
MMTPLLLPHLIYPNILHPYLVFSLSLLHYHHFQTPLTIQAKMIGLLYLPLKIKARLLSQAPRDRFLVADVPQLRRGFLQLT